jgi:hypothetical protein
VSTHNSTRANAQPPPNPPLNPLCWKATVAATAQSWADACNYGHSGTPGLGENIYACASSDSSCPTNAVNQSVTSWAAESVSYDYPSNTCSPHCQGGANNGAVCSNQSQCPGGICSGVCGHYTQIVWRSTTHIGCGVENCTTNSPFGPSFPNWTFVVCNYEPPGNIIGQQPY